MEFTLSIVLFCVGLYAVMVKRNLLKIIIGIAVMGYAINLFLVLAGFRMSAHMPILEEGVPPAAIVDPVTQAMVLVTVILGLVVTLLLTALAVKLHEKYGTFDISEIKKLKG